MAKKRSTLSELALEDLLNMSRFRVQRAQEPSEETQPRVAASSRANAELNSSISNHHQQVRRSQRVMANQGQWTPHLQGQQVQTLEELRHPRDYMLICDSSLASMKLVLRRTRHETSDLGIEEFGYTLRLLQRPTSEPVLFSAFSFALLSTLSTIYRGMLALFPGSSHEVQFEVTHPEMSAGGGSSSSIVPLTAGNEQYMLQQLLDSMMSK